MLFQAEKQGISLNPRAKSWEPRRRRRRRRGDCQQKGSDRKTVNFLYTAREDARRVGETAAAAEAAAVSVVGCKIKPRANTTRVCRRRRGGAEVFC